MICSKCGGTVGVVVVTKTPSPDMYCQDDPTDDEYAEACRIAAQDAKKVLLCPLCEGARGVVGEMSVVDLVKLIRRIVREEVHTKGAPYR